jgi:hypothetical protein
VPIQRRLFLNREKFLRIQLFLERLTKGNRMRELTHGEINDVSGAGTSEAGTAAGLAAGIGTISFGAAALGTISVAAAFAASPIAAVAMVGLAAYAGYQLATK